MTHLDTSTVNDVCPIHPAVELVFSRWTTPILWILRQDGRLRFTELHDRLPSITAKVLTQRLRHLERDGLVIRTFCSQVPPRAEYEISPLGETLSHVFSTLVSWSDNHLNDVYEARRTYDASGRPLPS